MNDLDVSNRYHELAKDAGNRLRAYILSVSSGATGVFFFALTNTDQAGLTACEKGLLLVALVSFVITAFLCLYELRVDAQRFFALAKEFEKANLDRKWGKNERYKVQRFWLIHSSYLTLGLAIFSISIYLVINIVSN